MESVLYTGEEIAKILKVSRSKAFSLIRNGEIKSVRIGRNVRVRAKDLEEFIEAHCVDALHSISFNLKAGPQGNQNSGFTESEIHHG